MSPERLEHIRRLVNSDSDCFVASRDLIKELIAELDRRPECVVVEGGRDITCDEFRKHVPLDRTVSVRVKHQGMETVFDVCVSKGTQPMLVY